MTARASPAAAEVRAAPSPPSEAERALLLASAFLDATPERLAALRERAQRTPASPILVRALELHGILPLAARNLRAAGAALAPPVAEALAERERALREEGLRDLVTRERLLAAAERAGVAVTLLKGASLALDVYGDPLLRSQGDVDVLVDAADVRALVAAAAEEGLVEAEDALPLWWHRAVHFHAKLAPALALLKEVEVHWRLHHEAALLLVTPDALRARRVAVQTDGRRAFTLDPLDRFLHLATHLARAWNPRGERSPEEALAAALAVDPPRLRVKWLVDLAATAERLAASAAPAALAARVAEWGAEAPLSFVARALAGTVPLSPQAAAFLASALPGAAPAGAPRTAGQVEESPRPPASERAGRAPFGALDFRLEALAEWPRWLWPPAVYWRRRLPGAGAPTRTARRLGHALAVLARSALVLALAPAALAGRSLLRPARRRARARATAPERVLDVAAAWRARQRDAAATREGNSRSAR